jgi:hypothetical protein
MPGLRTYADFDRMLQAARAELARMAAKEPDFFAITLVQAQVEALHAWTRDGRCPAQGEKDSLHFGAIASRELDGYAVAPDLYALASFVTWWGEPGHPPFPQDQ